LGTRFGLGLAEDVPEADAALTPPAAGVPAPAEPGAVEPVVEGGPAAAPPVSDVVTFEAVA